jgi:hypothetical protein
MQIGDLVRHKTKWHGTLWVVTQEDRTHTGRYLVSLISDPSVTRWWHEKNLEAISEYK